MKRLFIYVLLAAQMIGLGGIYAWHATERGSRYLLATRPVDPRDLLRGDYVILAYEIDRLPAGMTPPAPGEVFVRLRAEGSVWGVDAVDSAPGSGGPWLRARWNGHEFDYGIGKFFIPEGSGAPDGIVTVEISVQPGGRAQIRRLFRDGAPWP